MIGVYSDTFNRARVRLVLNITGFHAPRPQSLGKSKLVDCQSREKVGGVKKSKMTMRYIYISRDEREEEIIR